MVTGGRLEALLYVRQGPRSTVGIVTASKAKILLVEDEIANRALLQSWLGGQGYAVRVASSGEAGLEMLYAEQPDLVLLDIVMPGLDGFEVLEKIRLDYNKDVLPVIMLTGRDGSGDVINAFRLGANDYAKKPVDFHVLRKRMETHLSHKAGTARLIANFQILEKIGSGGMGIVYSARHALTDAPAAVKVLHRSMTFDDEYVTRFIREASLAARVNHPNVVKVLDAGRAEETFFLAMELVEGRNLYELTVARSLGTRLAVSVVRQIAGALGALRAEGIMHRDIKPENVLVTPEGVAKLSDFGIARDLQNENRLTEPGVGFGSLAYVSPEQMVGNGDHRADIYSLGSTLFFSVTGRDPFPANKSPEVTLSDKTRPAPRANDYNPHISTHLADFLQRMMHPTEKGRVQDYEEIIAELTAEEKALELPGADCTPWWEAHAL